MSGADGSEILIGIDAGTTVIKAVAFDLAGHQIAVASVPNVYTVRSSDGAAFQGMDQTWRDCVATLRMLGEKISGLATRTIGIAVTAQGDGTWLVGADNRPVTDGWIWLDARAGSTVARLRSASGDRRRFETTGTGLNACQMGTQLAHLDTVSPELLDQAEVSLHPKDWLYLNLTGVRATDPSEANFTFGNFRTRTYDDAVIDALGLTGRRRLLPEILDGSQQAHPLLEAVARQVGLRAGTPVSLGYVDVVCTAIGGGILTEGKPSACTIIGSTGMHMRAMDAADVRLNEQKSGYVMVLPFEGMVAQIQSNMASTLNIDWLLAMAEDLMRDMGAPTSRAALIDRIDGWLSSTRPARMIFHPYISDAGERGPFVNPAARASLVGVNSSHRIPDLFRAVIEGLGMAARDCYAEMGPLPSEIRLTGGAARSRNLRDVLGAAVGADVRVSGRQEAGAGGAAMMSAVAIGVYPDMATCIDRWVTPELGPAEPVDAALAETYGRLFSSYLSSRLALAPVWDELAWNKD